MQLYFEHPTFLWLWVVALPLLVFAAVKSYAIAPRWKRIASFGVRAAALGLLALALARPVLRMEKPDQAVVFLVDVSDSVPRAALERAVAEIERATRAVLPHQRAALVAFAGRPRVLRPLAPEPITVDAGAAFDAIFHRTAKDEARAKIAAIERDLSGDGAATRLQAAKDALAAIERLEAELETGETDLREALRLARSVLPEDARRRVVLYSDGNWTRGDPERELAFLSRSGVAVDTRVAPQERAGNEIVAERLVAPGQVKIREPVELELHVGAAVASKATVKLYRDGFLLKSDEVQLQQGHNLVRVPKQELEEGFHEFLARVEVEDDPRPENNQARAVVVVTGRPRVLLVEGREQDARALEQALRNEDIQVEVRPAVGFPEDLNDLLGYDVLILSDVPATDLLTTQLAMVKSYVRDFGGGLIMLGGEKSFGLGGYYRTPVEDALPVRMPIKKTIEKPNLAMVLVIDRSGSMSGEKLALAKEAAIAAVDVLKPKDQIGVVVFDTAPDWVVELQSAGNREEIVNQISRVTVGGGTYIYAGLYRAYEALHESNAKLRHAIVLTDGHTEGTRAEHLDLVSHMVAEDMTLSTVGIGEADQDLLQAMAQTGGGEAYFTNDFGSIPQIFSKETLRASRSMLVEEPFVPVPTGARDQTLVGIELADAPLLMGYVATSPKEKATVVLVSDHGDPILARWNYGLGRSLAWTSDAKAHWAGDWVAWPQFGKFWSQVVRSVMATGTTSALQQTADVRVDKGEVRFTIDTRDREGRFLDEVLPRLSIVDANGAPAPVAAQHVAPGLYEATFPLRSYGEFLRLRVESMLEGKLVGLRSYAVVESYPPEYRAAAADGAFLEHVSAATGGRARGLGASPTGHRVEATAVAGNGASPVAAVDAAAEAQAGSVFAFEGEPARGLRDLWRLCLLLAACLLPLDIALRRLW